jgi:hypothetical protein
VEHLRDTGLSPDAADAKALDGLGDATTANRALRKTYLTTWQQRLLASLAQPVKPLKKTEYDTIMLLSSVGPFFAIEQVCFDYGETPFARYFGYLLVFMFCILFWLGDAQQAVRKRLWRSKEDAVFPEKPTAMDRPYPWFLMACLLWLWAIWRIQYQPNDFSPPSGYVVLGALLIKLPARIHRSIGAYCFDASVSRSRARTGLTGLYVVLLALASAAFLCWPPSWSCLRSLFRVFAGLPVNTTVEPGGHVLLFMMSSLAGISLALFFIIVAIRWITGLYLLRKDVNGDGNAAPAPFPETPLGE